MGKRRVLSYRQKALRSKVKMRERRARKEKDLLQDNYKDLKYHGPRRRQHLKQDEEELTVNIDEAYIDTVLESEKPTITSECPIANVYSTLSGDPEIKTEKHDTVDHQQHVMMEYPIANVYSTLSGDREIKTEKPDTADNHHVTSESDFVVETESSEQFLSEDKLINEEQPDPSLDNLEVYLEWSSPEADQSFIAVPETVYNNLPDEIFQGLPS